MTVFVLGAGASLHAGYPLAGELGEDADRLRRWLLHKKEKGKRGIPRCADSARNDGEQRDGPRRTAEMSGEGLIGAGGEQSEEGGFVFIGEVLDLAGASAGYVDGVPGGKELLIGLAEEFIPEFEGAGFGFEDAGADSEEFVVTGGMMIAAVGVGDNHVGVVLKLHLLVVEAEGAHELDAADLKPDEEVGVVNNAHLIGFGVAHADGDVMMSEHWR